MSTFVRRLRILVSTLAVSCGCCIAQSTAFVLSSGSANPGSTVTLDISMDTNAGISPASVEWTITYPPNDFSAAAVGPGSMASAANKSVSCNSAPGTTTCVLWGKNNTAMGNGVVATVDLTLSGATTDSLAPVQLSVPMAADPSGFALTSSASGGTVTINQPAALNGFTCSPASVTPPATSTCTLQLTAGAPSGGASIAVSSNPGDLTMPPSVGVPQGASSASFTVTPLPVSATTLVDLNASYLGLSEGFGLTLNPVPLTLSAISVGSGSLVGSATYSGVVTLSGPAGNGGATITLSSSNVLAMTLPATVTVPPGASSVTFSLQTLTILAKTNVTAAASYSGASVSANLQLLPRPHALTNIQVNPSNIQSGRIGTGTVTLSGPAGVGGVLVDLYSSNAAAAKVPVSVTVLPGNNTASFTITAGKVTTNTPVTLTAFDAGLQETTTLTVLVN